MRAERKSPATVTSYTEGVLAFLRWSELSGLKPEITKATVQAFTADLLDGGAQPSTARSRQMALRRFAAWLVDEGELDTNPMLGVKPPKLDSKVVDALSDDQLRRLVKACAGKELIDRRDEAIVRLMAETGLRAGEVLAIQMADVDLHEGRVIVRRGKGGKGRTAPFGAQTAAAIDRYMRARRSHRLSDTTSLVAWRQRPNLLVPRAQSGIEAPSRRGRHRRIPFASDAAHCGDPVAPCRWLRGRLDERCGLVDSLDGRPLYWRAAQPNARLLRHAD